ncbi:MAG: hypothetical protein QG635_2276, partial [Bacteroidota bacterium]|nr:hypothetical protein [Bacteroidota bacterium]
YKESMNFKLSMKKAEKKGDKPMMSPTWNFLGPSTNTGGYGGLGRVNCVRVNPSTPTILWAGSASGGLWKSTNGGTSWVSNTDDLPTLGITDIVIDPNLPTSMFIATGDGDGYSTYSVGVMKSEDGGASWSVTGLNWQVAQVKTISRLLMSPMNSSILFAAASDGVWKTSNGGINWTRVLGGNFKDMEFCPSDPNIVYVCGTEMYVTRNNGGSWTKVQGLPTNNIERMAIAVTPALGNNLYTVISDSRNSGLLGVYKSTDNGDSWLEQTGDNPNLLGYETDGADQGGQGWYDLCIAVSPTNANELYVGGVCVWKSTNGGLNWTMNAFWHQNQGFPVVHCDHHDLFFVPGTTTLYDANDGGVYKTVNGGSTWQWIGNQLKITQFYRLGCSASNPGTVIAGSQDNGTKLLSSNVWSDVLGGDGMECIIDYTNSNNVYAEAQNGEIYKSTNGGSQFGDNPIMSEDISHENAAWVTPIIMHPANSQILYTAYQNVWKTTNGGAEWSKISDFPTPANAKYKVLQISPSDPNVIYYSPGYQYLYRTTDGGSNWANFALPSSMALTYIAVEPTTPNKIWACFSGFASGNKVYVSINGGLSWDNISGNLPNVPVNCIIFQNNSNNRLFVGTDIGVFIKDDSNPDWQDFNEGLPNVVVNELEIQYGSSKLKVASYGRGLWDTPIQASAPVLTLISPINHAGCQKTGGMDISWNAYFGAASYTLQVGLTSDFASPFKEEGAWAGTNYTLTNLENAKKYYWHVKPNGTPGSDWSETWDFTTTLAKPELDNPDDAIKGFKPDSAFYWKAVTGATSYGIDISETQNFSSLDIQERNLSQLKFADVLNRLEYNTKYYWRVNATDNLCTSDWSDVRNVTIVIGPPRLLAPVNQKYAVPFNQEYSWTSSAGANSYHIQISTSRLFETVEIDSAGLTDLKFTDTKNKLKYNTTYFWRLSAANADGTSPWSEPWEFKTIIAAPALQTPDNHSSGIAVDGTLLWQAVQGADIYKVQLSVNADFSNPLINANNVATNSLPFTNLENNKKYYWHVKAENAYSESPWSETWDFTTKKNTTGLPVLAFPANNAKDVPVLGQLRWQILQGASEYTVNVSTQPDFSQLTINQTGITDTLTDYSSLVYLTKYYWRVKAKVGAVESDWSDVWNYTTADEVIQAPSLVSPTNNIINAPLNGLLKWNDVQGADAYSLQVSKSSGFGTKIIDQPNLSTSSYSYTNLEEKTEYFWHVKAKKSQKESEWSPAWSFTTIEVISVEGNPDNEVFKVICYPNPFSNSASMSIEIKESCRFSLKIYNSVGEEIIVIYDQFIEKGFYSKEWMPSNTASGVYYASVEAGGKKAIIKLILKR